MSIGIYDAKGSRPAEVCDVLRIVDKLPDDSILVLKHVGVGT